MDHSPALYFRRAIPGGEIWLMLGDDDPAAVENCDGYVVGDRWGRRTFTALTAEEAVRVIDRRAATGEDGSGGLHITDLVLTRRGGVDAIVAAVSAVVADLPQI